VIYFGTFYKTLFPGLRSGYAVFPPSVLEGPLAQLISDGDFPEHIRQMRNRCRAARDLLAESLVQASGGDAWVRVPDQGLHLVAALPQGLPAAAAERIRSADGVEGRLLSETRMLPGGPDGFVLATRAMRFRP
jgi:GntR family transcriptional regulator/MocR family aminotransferase